MIPDRTDATGPLGTVARLGPFFAVETSADPDAGWRPLTDLATEAVLRERVQAARQVIAAGADLPVDDVEERATASIVFLGWAARLLSPALGAAAIDHRVPLMASAQWRASVSSPMPLALVAPNFVDGDDPGDLAGLLERHVVRAAIDPLVAAVGVTFAVSDQVLWGNVASALAGASKLIAHTEPGLARVTAAIVDRLFTGSELGGKGAFVGDPGGTRVFTRTTCCLFYRIPGAGTCGDCVLATR